MKKYVFEFYQSQDERNLAFSLITKAFFTWLHSTL